MALSTLIMLLIGYNYFFLMKHYPGTGGVYAYCKATLGRDHAFLSAWFLCLSYLSLIPQNATMMAAMCRAIWGNALRGGISYTVAGAEVYLGEVAVAIAVLILFGALAILQKPFLQHIQTALALVLFFGAAAIAILVTPHIPFDQLFTHPSAGGGHSLSAIMTIIILAPWAFVGFEVISLETAHFRFSMEKSGKLIFLRYSREALSTALWPCRSSYLSSPVCSSKRSSAR